jgi:hypothetical protein
MVLSSTRYGQPFGHNFEFFDVRQKMAFTVAARFFFNFRPNASSVDLGLKTKNVELLKSYRMNECLKFNKE